MAAQAEIAVEQVEGTLLIRGQKIPVITRFVKQETLNFFPENPRLYSLLKSGVKKPSQDEIENQLLELEHVRTLISDIKANGGLIEPLIVRDGTWEVLEGNSRLAAYRYLVTKDPITFGLVKCTILPKDIKDSLVFSLLGQFHIKGKKDWDPFEQAGFLYRRLKEHDVPMEVLVKEIGLTENKVSHLVAVYQFMLDHDTNIKHWSYYDEYLKSAKIRKARKLHTEIDKVVVAQVKSDEIERAVDIREKLSVICSGSPKTLKKYVHKDLDFEEAYEIEVEAGGESVHLKRFIKFKNQIVKPEVEKAMSSAKGNTQKKLLYEIDKIATRLTALRKKLTAK